MTAHETKSKIIAAGRVLAQYGHGDMTRGHLSARVPGKPGLFFMKAHSMCAAIPGALSAGAVFVLHAVSRARRTHPILEAHP